MSTNTPGHAGLVRILWWRGKRETEITTRVEPITKAAIKAALDSFKMRDSEIQKTFESYQADSTKLELSMDPHGNNCAIVYFGW